MFRTLPVYLILLITIAGCKGTSTDDLLSLAYLGDPSISWRSPEQGGDGVAVNQDLIFTSNVPLDTTAFNEKAVLKSTTTGTIVPFRIRSTGSNGYTVALESPLVLKNKYTFTVPTGTRTQAISFKADQVLRFSTVPSLQPVDSNFGAATDGIGSFSLPEGTTSYQASVTFGKVVTGVAIGANAIEIETATGCMNCASISNVAGSGAGPYTFTISGLLSAGVYNVKFGRNIKDLVGNFAASQITFAVAPVVSNVKNIGSKGSLVEAGWSSNLIPPTVAVDSSGNTYVASSFSGTSNFGGGARTATLWGLSVVKFDATGKYLWDRFWQFDTLVPVSLVADNSGVYFAGYGSLSSPLTLDIGVTALSAGAGANPYVMKINASGTAIWASRVNQPSGNTTVHFLRLAQDGNLVMALNSLTGNWNGAVPGTGPILTGCLLNSVTSGAILIVGVDATTGNCRWPLHLSTGFEARDMAFDGSYNYIIGNLSNAGTPNLATIGALPVTAGNTNDIFVARIGANSGNLPDLANGGGRWVQRLGGTAVENGNGIAIDAPNSRLYITGSVAAPVNFGCSATPCTAVGSAGTTDGFVAAFNPANQVPLWANTIGGTNGTDEGFFVTAYNNRARVFSKYNLSVGNVKVNQFGCAFNNFNGFGSQDLLMTMYDNNGTFVGARFFGTPVTEDIQRASFVHQTTSGRLTIGLNLGTGILDTTPIISSANPSDVVIWQMD